MLFWPSYSPTVEFHVGAAGVGKGVGSDSNGANWPTPHHSPMGALLRPHPHFVLLEHGE